MVCKQLIFFAFALFATTVLSQKSDLRKQVEKIIKYDSDIDFTLTPALLVGVIDHHQVQIELFGKENESFEKLDSQSIFELGSISKAITSQILLKMVEENYFQISSEINGLLPPEYFNQRMVGVTIKDMLNFRSKMPHVFKGRGLFEHDPGNPYEYFSKENLLQFYKNYIPEQDLIGDSYSDTDFALLEIIMERATGISFDKLIEKYINQPLDAHFFTTAYEKKESIVTSGMNRAGSEGQPLIFQSFAASEGIKGSIADVMKLVSFWLVKYRGMLDSKQQFKALPETWTSRIRGLNGMYSIDVGKSSYPLVCNGLTNIHHSFVGFLPKTETAVIVMANSGTGTKDLGMLILRMVNNNWKRKM